jgi:hypothetical protein
MPARATRGTSKSASSSRSTRPRHGGDAVRKAQEWGGGAKGAKGAVTRADKRNRNSSAKS